MARWGPGAHVRAGGAGSKAPARVPAEARRGPARRFSRRSLRRAERRRDPRPFSPAGPPPPARPQPSPRRGLALAGSGPGLPVRPSAGAPHPARGAFAAPSSARRPSPGGRCPVPGAPAGPFQDGPRPGLSAASRQSSLLVAVFSPIRAGARSIPGSAEALRLRRGQLPPRGREPFGVPQLRRSSRSLTLNAWGMLRAAGFVALPSILVTWASAGHRAYRETPSVGE